MAGRVAIRDDPDAFGDAPEPEPGLIPIDGATGGGSLDA
jgi:hypothetical protein